MRLCEKMAIEKYGDDPEKAKAYEEGYQAALRGRWIKCAGHRKTCGYLYFVLCKGGLMGVARYRGQNRWEGYKGFVYKDITHFAYLPILMEEEQ